MARAEFLSGDIDGFTFSIIVGGVCLIVFWRFSTLRLDSQEPPSLKSKVPVIGHMLGLITGSHGYYLSLYNKKPMPACTLPMASGKMYVLNSPELVTAAFKARTLSFGPHVRSMTKYIIPISQSASDEYCTPEFYQPWSQIFYSVMTGPELVKMNATVLTDLFSQINNFPQNMEVEDTWIWHRNMFTNSTISALLGKENPWRKDHSLIAKFWEYERSVHHFVAGPVPRLTAPSAYKARADLHQALIECNFDTEGDKSPSTSLLIQKTMTFCDAAAWSNSDKAAMLIALLIAAVVNTTASAYWYLMHLMSSPPLLAKLRTEAQSLIIPGPVLPDKKRTIHIPLSSLIPSRAPLLIAAFRETQRVVGVGSMVRWVEADTMLSDGTRSYLLKKDIPVMIPSLVPHSSAALWGSDVDEFRPERFFTKTEQQQQQQQQHQELSDAGGDVPVPRGAFIPFGGGKHLCPGRNFASVENWGTMATLLLGFDIVAPEGEALQLPERTMPLPTAIIGRPVKGSDLRACVRRRKGWEDVVWKVVD
ncbi:hypothetical protein DL765_007852 [Monosporascus sp. GIB2]|nr:hypothetical protein DL765_007852 [Monosporascus sp. GIB2]